MKDWRKSLFLAAFIFFLFAIAVAWKDHKRDEIPEITPQNAELEEHDFEDQDARKADGCFANNEVEKLKKYMLTDQNAEELEYLQSLTQEDIQQIGGLSSLKNLKIFIQDESVDLSPLGNLDNLEELVIGSSMGYCLNLNTQPLGKLKSLKKITLMNCSFDASFLAELTNLEEVMVLKCDNIENLAVFNNMQELKDLYITYADDVDLNDLQSLITLERIDITGNYIRNFEGLENLTNLKELRLCETKTRYEGWEQILDMNIFSKMEKLENVLIAHISVEDIEPLSEMEYLKMISLIDTGITDVEPLKNLKSLEALNICGSTSTQIAEQAEKYLTDVKDIYISEEIPYPY